MLEKSKELLNKEILKEISDEQLLKELLKVWGMKDNEFIGIVPEKIEGKNYIFIKNVKTMKGEEIVNPFAKEVRRLDLYCSLQNINLKQGDLVKFKIAISRTRNDEEIRAEDNEQIRLNKIIKVDETSLKKSFELDENKIENLNEIMQNYKINKNIMDKIKLAFEKSINVYKEYEYKLYLEKDIENLFKNSIDKFTDKYKIIEKEIISIKNIKSVEEEKLEKIRNEYRVKEDKFNSNIEKLDQCRRGKLAELEYIMELENRFCHKGIIKEKKEVLVDDNKIEGNDKIVNHIIKYLSGRKNKRLIYSREIIEQFIMGLNTNQIIIIGGAPGSGKTSLVEGIADAIKAECEVIAVRPNWNSTEDLLGFYNPMEKKYIPTAIIDKIIEAQKNPEKLFFICLDEMNIACIEEYFSEILSALYTESKIIKLYSEEIVQREIEMNKQIELSYGSKEMQMKEMGIEKYYEMESRLNNLACLYTPKIKIGNNIKFIGTINRDSTTKDLSPKVIDRSVLINLNSSLEVVKNIIEENIIEPVESIKSRYVSPKQFIVERVELKEVMEEFESIIRVFDKNNIEINFRTLSVIAEILMIKGINRESLKDYIIATKILPKVNIAKEEISDELLTTLETSIGNKKVSKEIYEEMIRFYERYDLLTYWR